MYKMKRREPRTEPYRLDQTTAGITRELKVFCQGFAVLVRI